MEVLSFGLKRCPHCCQKFVWGFFSPLVRLDLRIECGRKRSSFSSLTTVQVSLNLFVMAETTWASFRTLSMCFPLNTLSHFALHGGFLSFLTLGDWSSFHNFASDSEVSSSHHLINMKFYRSSVVNNLSVHLFRRFLDRTKPRRSEAEQESSNFDVYNPSKIISEGISRADNWTWSHRASKS